MVGAAGGHGNNDAPHRQVIPRSFPLPFSGIQFILPAAPGQAIDVKSHPTAWERVPERESYWDGVGRQWLTRRDNQLWRRCSDAIHQMWLDHAAAGLHGMRIMKTDLFDEAFGDGLNGWFERRDNQVFACDLAFSTARGAAKRQKRLAAVVADVRRLPFPANVFDCVFSDSTLDHFAAEAEILRSLEELGRVLRPGGTLLLTMDNPRHPLVWLRNLQPRLWMRVGVVPYVVGVTCNVRRLGQLLERAGFEVRESGAIMHSPRVLLVPLCRWLERHLGWHEPSARWRRWLLGFEGLGRLPFRQLSGHFVTVVARKTA
jgi:SAM-dependent methyltransferase